MFSSSVKSSSFSNSMPFFLAIFLRNSSLIFLYSTFEISGIFKNLTSLISKHSCTTLKLKALFLFTTASYIFLIISGSNPFFSLFFFNASSELS